ncbi:caspase family protein [Spirosoma jeollabukense]
MVFSNLPSLEERFRRTGNGGEYVLKPIAVPVSHESLTLNGLLCIPAHRSGYYHDTVYAKERIVLHFTAGGLTGDMSTLTRQDYHVSVPFVIARDGTVYQLYSSKFWSGNLGGEALGNAGNNQDKRTIGIEISNYGPLTPKSGGLQTIYGDTYCTLTQSDAFQKLTVPFRGESTYATFTDAQYDSLIVLLRYLTTQYAIPRQFIPEPKRYLTTPDVLTFRGIVSHVNYRQRGKWDLGPAFNWARVITGVQAGTFVPAQPQSRDLALVEEAALTSEEAMIPLLPQAKSAALEDEPYEDANWLPLEMIDPGPETTPPATVYALIVGVDTYQSNVILQNSVRFPALRGCVNDAQAVKTYLETGSTAMVKSLLLTNEAASKAAIVKAFQTHLSQAKAGDVALFYFSGHGTQEWADKTVWTSETDGRLECLACYYDEQTSDDFLLVDKELRYLIGQLAASKPAAERPQIVAIFDCCHSGDNTRNGEQIATAFTDVVEKRIPFSFQQRAWEQFIFGQTISEDTIRQQGVAKAIPEGTHVQLSACESDESALEVSGEGVFTKTLLNVLRQAGGPLSYYSLRSRVRQYLRNVFDQRPRIYVANGDDALLYANFLHQPGQANALTTGEIVYVSGTNGGLGNWLLNRGAIHGITPELSAFVVTDPHDPLGTYRASVGTVQVDHTYLTFEGLAPNNLKTTYQAAIPGLMARPIAVCVNHQDSSPLEQKQLMDGLMNQTIGYVVPQDDESRADYVVQNRDGRYYITLPNDPFRPLTQPVNAGSDTTVLQIADQLRHLSQWAFLASLTNAGSNALPASTLQVECVCVDTNGGEVSILQADGSIPIQYEKAPDGVWRSAFRMKVTNPTPTKLYCSVLYLDTEFQSFLGFLNPTTYLLEPGNSVYLSSNGKNILKSRLPAVTQAYNWPSRIEYLKFIVSTDEFDVQSLALAPLPEPPLPGQPEESGNRGSLETDESSVALKGWSTQQYRLHLVNPVFNRIEGDRLDVMLTDLRTAPFALGLYFDAGTRPDWQIDYQLKPEIQLVGASSLALDERGFISGVGLNLANAVARKLRNQHYQAVIKQFPDRIRMVSEGDSWFQHPLVTDIIDHLGRVYAIHCVAAAGDTLRNIQRMGEYLDDIDEQKPTFFLLSGGGNDILGDQFRTYLKDKPDMGGIAGENPRRFLKDELFSELDSLRDVYQTVFGLLKTSHPDLHILVHGYDYIIPLSVTDKGWLGRYMIEKGIDRQEDRQAVISLILDEFNNRMQSAASSFSNVSYINALNTVRPNQWYDEIHPNSDGFQQVAMKFMKRINEVLALRTTPA